MEKLEKLEVLLKYEIENIKHKQLQIPVISNFKTIQEVMTDLDVHDTMKYIKRMYYYWKIDEMNRYLKAIQQMKKENITTAQ